MKLKSVNNCGTATVELYYDEILMLVALIKNTSISDKSDTTGIITTCSCVMEDALQTVGILTKLCSDSVDHKAVNAKLDADPIEALKDYNTVKGE